MVLGKGSEFSTDQRYSMGVHIEEKCRVWLHVLWWAVRNGFPKGIRFGFVRASRSLMCMEQVEANNSISMVLINSGKLIGWRWGFWPWRFSLQETVLPPSTMVLRMLHACWCPSSMPTFTGLSSVSWVWLLHKAGHSCYIRLGIAAMWSWTSLLHSAIEQYKVESSKPISH